MKSSIKVVHIAITPLAGAPIRIVNALNSHTRVVARLVVLNPLAYDTRTFEGDLIWERDKEETLSILREADLIHFHHFFELESNPFGIDFRAACPLARFVRHFHTHPLTIALGDKARAQQIVQSELPQLVVAQYQERFYPRARVVPNIVPVEDDFYKPVHRNDVNPKLYFAPSVNHPAVDAAATTRWETKGAHETERLLQKVVTDCRTGRIVVRRNISHEQCLRERQASDIAIDEMVTGSFHLTSLESIAQGLPTFAYLDSRCLETLSELTGSPCHPWLNFRLEEAQHPLIELVKDGELRREIGAFARTWMEKYYNDREMVNHYVRAYDDLIDRPETFQQQRFNPASRRAVFLAQRRDDLVWQSRQARRISENAPGSVAAQNIPVFENKATGAMPEWIKVPVHNLLRKYTSVRVDEILSLKKRLRETESLMEFVAADETHRWLYQNRLERMDATLDIFDDKRREFHLDRYRFAADRVRAKRVLDCACGTGYGVRMLHEIGGAEFVFGVDSESKAIEYSEKNHRVDSTAFLCSSGDCLAVPDNSFDIVTSFETIEHVADDLALLKEFHRVLRSNGILIISTPNQWPLAESPFHVREYGRQSFVDALESCFACLELYNQNSGSETPLNRGQPQGIVATTTSNEGLAECYIAVCRR